jgi:hypothetical protein
MVRNSVGRTRTLTVGLSMMTRRTHKDCFEIVSLNYLFYQYLLSAYGSPGIVLGSGEPAVTKTNKMVSLIVGR